MTLPKTTIENSGRYHSKDNHSPSQQAPHISKERDSKPNTRKKKTFKKYSSTKNKKLIKNTTGEGFGLPNLIMNCYF